MAVALVSPITENKDESKINKCAVKLLGLENSDLTEEEILECMSFYIEPRKIEALIFDSFNNFYVLFLIDIESACRVLGKKLEFRSHCIKIYPLLDCYVIQNVYPCVTNENLADIFRTFGNVFNVSNHHAVPNSSKFSHVLSGKREVTFLLPGKEIEIYIPANVVHPPYSFHAKKFCCACLTEGHSILYCPDIEEDETVAKIKFDDEDGDDELDSLIKHEMSENNNFGESLPDVQLTTLKENSKENEQLPQNKSENKVIAVKADEKKDNEKKGNEDAGNAHEANSKKLKTASEKGAPECSTTSVCKSAERQEEPTRRIIKGSTSLLPPLAEQLIGESCGASIVEANVLKQLVITDARNKQEMVRFASSYLEDMSDLFNLLKKVIKQCCRDSKYTTLCGPFVNKLQRIRHILSTYCKPSD